MLPGPLATLIRADQGADVIKVESPGGGDHTRQVSTRRGGFSASFLNNNRNKRSLSLNLKDKEGVAILKRLLIDADVFVQNFRPGVIERMGLGEAAVRAVRPDIVYVSISGFGAEGPLAHKPVFDPLVQALSGLTTVQAGSDEARPRLVRTILPDKLTGVTAAQAITAALLARERRGEGQHVRVSMLDSVVAFLWGSDMGGQTFVGDEIAVEKAQSFIDLIYETTDGYISVAVQTDRQWAGLANALGRPEWLEDERFTTPALRQRNIDARLALTQEVLRTRSSEEWLALLDLHDVPSVPVLNRRGMVEHPQIAANQTLVETEHPAAGRLRQARPAAIFSRTRPEIRRGGPGLGEHSDAILAELGYDPAAVDSLRAAGVIGPRPAADAAGSGEEEGG
jgi:crotonobetainyl-CoA:carnitine CoA-transferase CaiB-like acyl-CoA transferase